MKIRENPDPLEQLLDELEPPLPPPELRWRVLAAARDGVGAPLGDQWSKIWNSRGLRMAWAASVMILVAGHAVLSLVGNGPRPTAMNGRPDLELAEFVRPVEIAESVVPMIGRSADAEDVLTAISTGGDAS